ncbi:hypothetical protein I4U23_000816 [Adineta vaga]|nr:hypothetical protein I4U23_000816 [Adineta vaga]
MIGIVFLLTFITLVQSLALNVTGKNEQCCGTCFLFGCPDGQCCSQYGYCGSTPEHCEGARTQGDCQTKGCPNGLCCSKYGYCGNTAEHCDNTPITNGNCKTQGCPAGQCCSAYGFCGTTVAHCGNIDLTVGQGNCQQTGCARGLCCSRFGYCGSTPQHCAGSTNGVLLDCTGCFGKCTNETCLYGHCISDQCVCDPGIYGEICNKDIKDCEKDACLNNGTCIELVNGFDCRCPSNFDGSRCQYHRTNSDNLCRKKCLNYGKCIVLKQTEKCACSSAYYGSECEHTYNDKHNLSSIRKCSLLKLRNSHDDSKCLAIDLTPLFDVHCECQWSDKQRNIATCQITPSPYSNQKCSFKKPVTIPLFSTLPDPIHIPVCPVNWEILDQYEKIQEKVNTVHIARCHLYSI